ncbi:MAG: bacillithiol biosynthesis cysteine-adding enzyme BshC [Acidobacteria bacterium]|nr:bacillithiol biosynthesis cysteine-adding enzyme BshC [Acidobacteriota bacterium]
MSPHLSVDLRRFPWIRPLAADYADTFDPLAPFFAGNPAAPGAWTAAIARAQAHPRRRAEVSSLLVQQQQRRGAPGAAVTAAERLADPRTVAILTGQQAGLFGGPLFTLLKALTAIRLAERVTREHQVPAVAVFWIDAEDHDWEEVRTCSVLDANLERHTISLGKPDGAGDRPVASICLDESAGAAVDTLAALLAPTEFTEALLASLRGLYTPGAGMANAFGRWLELVLGERGLVVFDASDPAAKPIAADVFVRELEHPGDTAHLAAGMGQLLRARGYHAQVAPHDASVALFDLDGGRRPIRIHDDHFVVGETPIGRQALIARAREHPASFSPNVLLRPVVQDTLFPTVAYVPGPNELAYLAQLKPVYEQFGVPMPLFFPRATATLIDSAGMRFLNRYAVPFEAFQPDDEALLNHLLESHLPSSVEQSYQDAVASIDGRMMALIEAVPAIDPTLQGAARSTLGRMQHDLQTLHSKIIHAAKRHDETLRRQFHRTRAQIFPGGAPQERSVGFIYFLNRYGPALSSRLLEELPLDLGRHWVLNI